MPRRLHIAMLFVLCSSPLFADDFIPRRQTKPPGPPLAPAEAVRKMTVPEGFTVEVVAHEPDLVNPVAMTFDARGRVWVTESLEYPRSSPGPGRDRVKVLEDTDADGRADKFTIFADGLNIPSGIAVGYGGVWVANAPDILFLQDTDGDGKADKREVVVTGFGRTDTHELPNSLTWGPDGWLYGLNGVFNYSHVKYPPGSPHAKDHPDGFPFTCAMFRIHPRTWEFQVFAEGTSNPWGIAFDSEGSAFVSACVIDHLWHLVETGYYHRQGGPYPPHTWKIESIVKHKHQLAAYCGIHHYDSDVYPEEYRDKLYMGNIHGNCVNSDALERRGSTYFGTPRPDFLSANDVWFMPVVQKTGPDGCLWVLDWYDRYHCYQDARRDPEGIDRLNGRLYRVRYQNTPYAQPFDLTQETDAQLIQRLHDGNGLLRNIAQRLLTERLTDADNRGNDQTRRSLRELVLDEGENKRARMHALWVLVSTQDLELEFHLALLNHADPSLRAWGVRAAGNMGTVAGAVSDQIHKMTAVETAPDVLLQIAIAAPKMPTVPTMPTLTAALANCGDDPLIPHIVWQNLHPRLERDSTQFLELVIQKPFSESANIRSLLPRVVDRLLSAERPPLDAVTLLFAAMLQSGEAGIEPAKRCLAVLAERVQTGEIVGEELQALREKFTPAVKKLRQTEPSHPLALSAEFLAASWRDPIAVKTARDVFADAGRKADLRLSALQALTAAQDEQLLERVREILSDPRRHRQVFRESVLNNLGRLQSETVAEVVLGAYAKLEPELQPKAIEVLTQRPNWAKSLLRAIGEQQVPANVLNANQARGLLAIGDPELTAALTEHWGVVREGRDPSREQFIAQMKVQLSRTDGDAIAGQAVFNKVCGQCHKIYGEGQDVGPDITRNGRNSYDQLLSNVFDPSLVIGADYRAVTVATTEGRVVTGLVVEDSPQRITLKIQGGKLETIARENVAAVKVSEVSLMPEGLEKQLKPQELADLFEFLTLDRPPQDPSAKRLPGAGE